MKHPFRKKWGQNFLIDETIISNIINCLNLKTTDKILEIGPGEGALTNKLVKKINYLYGIEIDPLLIKKLKNKAFSNATFFEADILKWDFTRIPKNIIVIGNLPYNISSPILFKLLKISNWNKMGLMFQKEVAERIISKPNSKSYGRLSIMCQVYCKTNIELIIPRQMFIPKPKVDSAFVTFSRNNNNNIPNIDDFSQLIKKAFSQRRKKLKNNLPEINKLGLLGEWAHMRPEELSPKNYLQLLKRI